MYDKDEVINPTICDALFGKFRLDDLVPGKKNKLFTKRELMNILTSVELQRLRDVRLSNINSLFLYSSSNVTRFEHSIGTAFLASKLVNTLDIPNKDKCHLFFAALLHDVATPPFGHTVEYVFKQKLPGYSHEENTKKILMGFSEAEDSIFGLQTQIRGEEVSSARLIAKIEVDKEYLDPKEIAKIIIGEHELGIFLNSPDLDLDNIDNISRLLFQLGFPVNRKEVIDTALGFKFKDGKRFYDAARVELLDNWLNNRRLLYNVFMFNFLDFSAKTMVRYATELAMRSDLFKRHDWTLTDSEFLEKLKNSESEIKNIIIRLRKSDFFSIEGLFLIKDENTIEKFFKSGTESKLEEKLSAELGRKHIINHIYDRDKLSREINVPIIDESFSKPSKYKIGKKSRSLLIGVFTEGHIKDSLKEDNIKYVEDIFKEVIGNKFSIFPEEQQLSLEVFR